MTIAKSADPSESRVSDHHDEPSASIDAAIQGALGRKLRESYDQVVKEQVPDKLLNLLDQLKQAERSGKTGAT